MDTVRLPRHLHRRQILFWDAEQFMVSMFALILGILTEAIFTSLTLGLILVLIMRRFQHQLPDGYLLHLLWWHGLLPMSYRTTPNPFERRVLPL